MNIKEIVSTPRFLVECLLIILISVLLFSRGPEIKVDPNGFAKDVFLNFALTGDGILILTNKEGKEITRSPKDKGFLNSKFQLHSIGTNTVDKRKKSYSISQGVLESLVPSAVASQLAQITITMDGQTFCFWYDDYTPC